jgi:putative copper export protein
VRAVVLAIGAFWVTGCLATVFVLAGRESTWWTPYGLPTQLAVLLLLLGVAPLLLLGLVHALTFEDEPDAEPSSGEDGGHAQGG